MGLPNLAVNRVMSRESVFADYINGTIYGGRQILKPEQLRNISPYVGTMVENAKGKKKARERHGDVWMQAKCGTYSVIFANEAQNQVDYAMPVRNMLYEALGYMNQVEEYEKDHRERKDWKDGAEFLSGITKDERLRPIITTVMYWGDRWDGPTRLVDMLNLGDGEDAETLKAYLRENAEEMDRMDKYETAALGVMIDMEKEVEKVLETSRNNAGEEGIGVCKAILDWMEENRTEGRIEGKIEGKMQTIIDLICKKLRKGKTAEVIAEEVERDLQTVQEICEVAALFAPEYDGEKVAEEWFARKTP